MGFIKEKKDTIRKFREFLFMYIDGKVLIKSQKNLIGNILENDKFQNYKIYIIATKHILIRKNKVIYYYNIHQRGAWKISTSISNLKF